MTIGQSTLRRDKLEPGDIVMSHGIVELKGMLGLVKGTYADVAIVSWPAAGLAEGNYKVNALRKLTPGDSVKYSGNKEGTPSKTIGKVVEVRPTLLVRVQYEVAAPTVGSATARYVGNELKISSDESGMVETIGEEGARVRFPTGQFLLPASDLRHEFEIPFVSLKYIDVKTAYASANRNAASSH